MFELMECVSYWSSTALLLPLLFTIYISSTPHLQHYPPSLLPPPPTFLPLHLSCFIMDDLGRLVYHADLFRSDFNGEPVFFSSRRFQEVPSNDVL